MKNYPVIGIVPTFDEGLVIQVPPTGIQCVHLRRDYLKSIIGVGAIPLQLSPEFTLEQITDICDGVVMSGGFDIDPHFYEEERIPELHILEPAERFEWERGLIDACDKHNVPVLGICYGLQRLNVHYGSSLIQDIPRMLGDEAMDHFETEHEIVFTDDFLGISTGEKRKVASRHHQALGRIGDGVEVCAVAPDGIIEAARVGERHYGMQWHPESDETGAHMYRAFVEHCERQSKLK